MSARGFRLLPHTADIRVEVRGPDLAGLFAGSVEALFSLLCDRRFVRRAEAKTLHVSGGTAEDRLFRLLKDALLLFAAERFLVRSARGRMDGSGGTVEVSGEPFDPSRHFALREIKAVTAHGLVVEPVAGGYVARFIVDV